MRSRSLGGSQHGNLNGGREAGYRVTSRCGSRDHPWTGAAVAATSSGMPGTLTASSARDAGVTNLDGRAAPARR